MKFKDLSYEELQKEFEKILDTYSDDDLIYSLKPYIINKEVLEND